MQPSDILRAAQGTDFYIANLGLWKDPAYSRWHHNGRNLQANIPDENKGKTLQEILGNQIQQLHQKNHIPWSRRVYC